jgi:uncharacterized SAM-binding protein YcdF (DUF218 family)
MRPIPVPDHANAFPAFFPRSRERRIFLAVLLAGGLLVVVCFLGVGRWLVVEDPLAKARAIAVLSGGMPLRAKEAAKLYREGYASEIWLTHSAEPGETLAAMNIPFEGEEYYNVRVLRHEGVPAGAIRMLEPPIVNTADEIRVIAAALAGEKDRTVIVVTTKAHTRRVRLLWRKTASGRGRAIVRAASGDLFDARHWWRNTGDALDVVREVLGLLNAWMGQPLRPGR